METIVNVAKVKVEAPPSTNTVRNSDFLPGKTLGKGGFGVVVQVQKLTGNDAGQIYARKQLNNCKKGRPERCILEAVRNVPFLMHMHYSYISNGCMYFVLEHLDGGDLTPWVGCSINVGTFLIKEIILAVEHLHRLRIVHRDIKIKNVLLDKDGHVVVGDYGISYKFPNKNEDNMMREAYNVISGTLPYMAPELLNREPYGFPVDWWAVGILSHELLAERIPFQTESKEDLRELIMNCDLQINPGLPVVVNNFIKNLLEKDQNKRLGTIGGAEELKAHEIFKDTEWKSVKDKRSTSPIKEIWIKKDLASQKRTKVNEAQKKRRRGRCV